MTIYDFTSDFYFRDNYDKIVMIDYVKKIDQVTQKEINDAMSIPVSNYRRAQQKGFLGYGQMLDKIASYLKIKTNFQASEIEELDHNFSRFYTCICFSQEEDANHYYQKIIEKRPQYENSILMITVYLAQLVHYLTDINYTRNLNIQKQEEAIEYLRSFVDKMSNEHRFLFYEYMSTYSAIKKDVDNVVHYARLTSYLGVNYPDLEPTANYHISFSYSLVSDFINALIYANKALPKLEEQLNYNKAVLARVNIAALYKKLGNIDEAKRLLKKNLVHMSFNSIHKLKRATELNYADCLLMEHNYKGALEHYNIILTEILMKPDYESIMRTYCMYQLNKIDDANAYTVELQMLEKEKKYPMEYLSLILFFRSYFNKEDNLDQAYKAAEELMGPYKFRGQYIQEVAKSLYLGNASKRGNKNMPDSNLAEYVL